MKKILIVEDDPATARIYRTCLERAGYDVHVATDGQAGLAYIQGTPPDGVLLDLMMPKMSGVELLKSIRATPPLEHIPIIVYTNAYVPQLVDQATAAGATQVFGKATLTTQTLIAAFRAIPN